MSRIFTPEKASRIFTPDEVVANFHTREMRREFLHLNHGNLENGRRPAADAKSRLSLLISIKLSKRGEASTGC